MHRRVESVDSSSIFVARQRRDSKLITTCRTLLFQGSKLLHKWAGGWQGEEEEEGWAYLDGVHRSRSSTRYLMNVGETVVLRL